MKGCLILGAIPPISFWAEIYSFVPVIHFLVITYLSKCLKHSETHCKMIKLRDRVEVENNTTYISYHYLKRTLWYEFMFYFVFYHLTRFGYLKIYKKIFRCEEILQIMT